jgi:ABC-2 type transport system ATP-binding protein
VADAIVLHDVTKTFGPKVAVNRFDLTVPQGALYGVIGPNGAGKTTTIRIILSILFADRGDVRVLGRASALEAKDRIGYLPEERGLYKKMKVGAFLEYMARLKNVEGDLRGTIANWLERVGLQDVQDKRSEELSKGMQQKVQFIAAVIHEPDLVILDEPFSGLDPVSTRQLRDLVHEQHARGATVLFSTHVMTQAEQLCDHIVMIHGGNKVLDSSLTEIRNRYAARALWFEPLDPRADPSPLRDVHGVRNVRKDGVAYEIEVADDIDPSAALREVAQAMPAARIELHRPTLEDVFIEIVSGRGASSSEAVAKLRETLRQGTVTAGEAQA